VTSRPHEIPQLHRQIFERNPAVQILVDPDSGRIVEANPAACAYYGYPRDELISKSYAEISTLAPDEITGRMARVSAGAAGDWLVRHRLASGELRDVEVRAGPLEVAGQVLIYSIVHDVTDRRRGEEAVQRQMAAFRAAMDGMAILDQDHNYVFLNQAHAAAYGYERPEDLIGRSWRILYDEEELRRFHRDILPELERHGRWRGEAVGRKRDGSTFAQDLSLTALESGLVCVVRDISERKRAERELRQSEERYRHLVEHSPDGIAIHSGGRLVFLNPAARRMLGSDGDAVLGRPVIDFVHPDSRALALERLGRVLQGDAVPPVEERFLRLDGTPIDVEVAAVPFSLDGEPAVQVFVRDVTDRKRAAKLQAALYRIAQTASGVEDMGSFYAAIHGIVAELMYAENFYIALYDAAAGTLSFPYFVDEADPLWTPMAPGKTLTGYVLRTGRPLLATDAVFAGLVERGEVETVGAPSVDWLGVPLLDGRGRAFGVVAVQSYSERVRFTDDHLSLLTFVSQHLATAIERKRAEEQIRSLAYHDGLTGLPNRLLFTDRLGLAVAQAHRLGQRLAVLFLDLDRLKVINDSLGHSVGDLLIGQVARRLQESVREGDTVARLGGDEFTLLLPGVHQALDAAKTAEKILAALRVPFQVEGRELFVTASVGISLYPDDGGDPETLIKNADTAMYRAKDQGRDALQLYAPVMNATALERLALENSLRKALAQDELTVFYQPIVDLGTGQVSSVEALLRWRHPQLGLVAPGEFVPLAEVTGLIVPMGPWVLRQACRQARAWHDRGLARVSVAVNLSARQIQQPDLVEQVTAALEESGLAARFLALEITESNAMQNAETTASALRALKAIGVRISIDDFGVGHSSLSYLRRLPIDTLKLDQSFVREIGSDPDQAAIVTAVMAMAHTLKLEVVAEGVETEEQLGFLAARGCDLIQGFLVSPALPASECEERLRRGLAGTARR
jgi:diguanylate cyclase (GGDEF)-like protein/PAS domain S-box-containing protein